MKVNLVFVEVQGAREAFGSLRFAFELHGKTVGDLIDEMILTYGPKEPGIVPEGWPLQGKPSDYQ